MIQAKKRRMTERFLAALAAGAILGGCGTELAAVHGGDSGDDAPAPKPTQVDLAEPLARGMQVIAAIAEAAGALSPLDFWRDEMPRIAELQPALDQRADDAAGSFDVHAGSVDDYRHVRYVVHSENDFCVATTHDVHPGGGYASVFLAVSEGQLELGRLQTPNCPGPMGCAWSVAYLTTSLAGASVATFANQAWGREPAARKLTMTIDGDVVESAPDDLGEDRIPAACAELPVYPALAP
jgi:hypothetical protein